PTLGRRWGGDAGEPAVVGARAVRSRERRTADGRAAGQPAVVGRADGGVPGARPPALCQAAAVLRADGSGRRGTGRADGGGLEAVACHRTRPSATAAGRRAGAYARAASGGAGGPGVTGAGDRAVHSALRRESVFPWGVDAVLSGRRRRRGGPGVAA